MPKFQYGTYVDDKGYLRISAGKHRGKRVATLVAEARLGRKLKRSEDVHHKNGDKLDANWRNLKVIDHTEHGFVSAKQAQFMKRKDAEMKQDWNEFFEETQSA
jgi:hypothetical protein